MDQDVELPADVLDGEAAVAPPAGKDPARPGADGQHEGRAEKRIKSLTGRLTGAEQAAERYRVQIEAAERRADEAERRAQAMSEAGHGLAEKNTSEALLRARGDLARATADGDTAAQAEAIEAIADARATTLALAGQKPQPRQERQAPQQQPQASPQAAAWMAENPWFGEDPAKRARALATHAELLDEGYADGGKLYFKELTARTRSLAGDGEPDDDTVEEPAQQRPAARPHAGAGVTRTAQPNAARPGTKVRLTAEQVETARDLGITVEAYAAGLQRATADGKFSNDRNGR